MSEIVLIEKSDMTAVANAIRSKTGITEKLTLSEMINGINDLVPVELPSFTNPAGSNQILVGFNAINDHGNVVPGNIPTLSFGSIGVDGTTITIPSGYYATDISVVADDYLEKRINGTLTAYSNEKITSIMSYAFAYCSSLSTANFPACTSIGGNAFAYCSSLSTADFPVCTSIGGNAFAHCSALSTANFPACTSIGSYAFAYCSSLSTANFPVCTSIGGNAFAYCSSLSTANFPVCTSIGGNAFNRCYNLSQLYLNTASVCTLSNSNAFMSTPYAGYSSYFSGVPYIYVPSSLVDAYRSATNWAYFSRYISAINKSSANYGGGSD